MISTINNETYAGIILCTAKCSYPFALDTCIMNKRTANGTKYARQIFKEAMILTFD
jgi:hypothetical protein